MDNGQELCVLAPDHPPLAFYKQEEKYTFNGWDLAHQ